jgi:formamidopyrimidine-DNA glycosylase
MPELAEVEFYRRKWITDHTIKFNRVFSRREKRVYRKFQGEPEELKNQCLLESYAHGKQMLFQFSGDIWLGIHLGMTGALHVFSGEYAPDRHDHLVLFRADGRVYAFRDPRQFGLLLLEKSKVLPERWKKLPPQILDSGFTREYLKLFLQKHSKSPIKSVLLRQECFPGIGNWMADEVLFQSGIHPECPSGKIVNQKLTQLYEKMQTVCKESIRIIAPDWGTPPDSWLFSHRWRDGGICPQSGCSLQRIKIGGRTSCFSPEIQVYGV